MKSITTLVIVLLCLFNSLSFGQYLHPPASQLAPPTQQSLLSLRAEYFLANADWSESPNKLNLADYTKVRSSDQIQTDNTYLTAGKIYFLSSVIVAQAIAGMENGVMHLMYSGQARSTAESRRISRDWHLLADLNRLSHVNLGISIAVDTKLWDWSSEPWWKKILKIASDVSVDQAFHWLVYHGIWNLYMERPWWEDDGTSPALDLPWRSKEMARSEFLPYIKITVLLTSMIINYLLFSSD